MPNAAGLFPAGRVLFAGRPVAVLPVGAASSCRIPCLVPTLRSVRILPLTSGWPFGSR
jgi:hypothetical protein